MADPARAMNDQDFYLDESGNVQRQNRRGEFGFRHFWKGRPELGVGNTVDYDWRKINRPGILEGQRQMFQRNPQSRSRQRQSMPANVREPEPYSGSGRFKNRQATPQQETPVNDPRSHKLTSVRVTGMDTVAGEMGERRGALPRGAQFDGTYIEPETAVGGTQIRGAIGFGPRALHPGAIETTAVSEHGSGKRKGQTYWEF